MNDYSILLNSFSILVHSLECWGCHLDDRKDCADISTNIIETCETDNDSCVTVIIKGSKLVSFKLSITTFIQKYYTKYSKEYSVDIIIFSEYSKGCSGLKKPSGCKESGNTSVCYCQGDFCNSNGSFQIDPVLIVYHFSLLASLLT